MPYLDSMVSRRGIPSRGMGLRWEYMVPALALIQSLTPMPMPGILRLVTCSAGTVRRT